MTKDKVVIVMPTYNEAENIGPMIEVLFTKTFPLIKNVQMHLLVVDDNSPDGTGKIVSKYKRKHRNLHILTGQKRGLGWAYVRGMRYAMDNLGASAVIEMDADFQHDPKYLQPMVKAFLDGADYVIGSRYTKGGAIPQEWEWYRKAISYFGNLFARVVLFMPKHHDVTTGFRLTRVKGVLDKIGLEYLMELKRFAYKIDLFYQSVRLSKKTVEVPIRFKPRRKEKSKFIFQEMIASYKVVLLLRLYRNKRFVKYGIVGFLGYVVNAVGLEVFYRLGAAPWLAAAMGAEIAIVSNFTFNNLWTFKQEKITSAARLVKKFVQFNLSSLGAVVIQAVVVGIGTAIVGEELRQLVLVFAVGFFIVPYNYAVYNLVIWRTWRPSRVREKLLSLISKS